jgi:hypothetical protein
MLREPNTPILHNLFTEKFRNVMSRVITPSFGKCVQALKEYGIRARQVDQMEHGHPNISLDIILNEEKGCRFLLSPISAEEKVGMRVLIRRHSQWNYDDTTRVDVDQITESLIRLKVQEAMDVLDDE